VPVAALLVSMVEVNMDNQTQKLSVYPSGSAQLLTTADAARALSIHQKTLGRWARVGLVPSYSTAGGYRFDLVEVRQALRTEAWQPGR
jgi:hypothetical protein